MYKLLFDANLSPQTAQCIREDFGYDVKSLIETGQGSLLDPEVVELAQEEARVIVTLDLDFGELYHTMTSTPQFGVLIVRLRDQRVEMVNYVLQKFFVSTLGSTLFIENPHALVVLDESTARVVL